MWSPGSDPLLCPLVGRVSLATAGPVSLCMIIPRMLGLFVPLTAVTALEPGQHPLIIVWKNELTHFLPQGQGFWNNVFPRNSLSKDVQCPVSTRDWGSADLGENTLYQVTSPVTSHPGDDVANRQGRQHATQWATGLN